MLRPSETKKRTVSKDGIVCKVDRSIKAIIWLMVTLLLLMFTTYFLMTRHAEKTYQIDLPSRQLSTSFLSDLHKMHQTLLGFTHDALLSLDTFNVTKKKLDVTLSSLLQLNNDKHSMLEKIDLNYQQYIQQIHLQIIDRFSAGNKTEATNQLKLINNNEHPKLEVALSRLLANNNKKSSALSNKDRRHYILLLKEISQHIHLYLNYYLVTNKNIDIDFSELENRFSNYLNLLTINARDDKDKINLDSIKQNFNQLLKRFSSIEIAHSPDSNIALNAALDHIQKNHFIPLKNEINTFIQTSNTQNQTKVNQLQFVHQFAPYVFTSLFFIAVFFAYWMKRNIVRRYAQPITLLSNQIDHLADGNTNIAPMQTTHVKEFDRMAQALVQFKAHLFSREQDHEQMIYQKEQADLSRAKHAKHLTTSSQEILTPLNGLIGTLASLQRTPLSPTQTTLANSVKETASSISHLVKDIVDFAYHDTGKMKLNTRPLDLRQLAENVIENLHPVAMEKNVSLSLYIPPNFDTALVGDKVRLQQMMANLVNNAINFSGNRNQKGQVSINIQTATHEHHQGQIQLTVRDNGIGIPSQQSDDIFAPFTQGENAKTFNIHGIGMGLSICQNIADLMNGKIQVTSSKDKGATFEVFFSLQKDKARQKNSEKAFLKLAAPLKEKQCLIILQASPLKTVLTQYMNALNIPYLSYSHTQVEARTLPQKQCGVLITNEPNIISSPSLKNQSDMKIIQLTEGIFDKDTKQTVSEFMLTSAPLKLSDLLHSLRKAFNVESIEIGSENESVFTEKEEIKPINAPPHSQQISLASVETKQAEKITEMWLPPSHDAMVLKEKEKEKEQKKKTQQDQKMLSLQSEHLDLSVISTLFLDNKSQYLSSLKQFRQIFSNELLSFSQAPTTETLQLLKQKARRYKTSSRSIGAYGISERCHTIEMDIIKENDTLNDSIMSLQQEVERSLPVISSVIKYIEKELNAKNG